MSMIKIESRFLMISKGKKVLHILGALNVGGAETMVMNVYKNIDFNKVKFDFIVNGPDVGYYEKEIDLINSKIYHITKRSESWVKHLKDIYFIIKNEKYVTIHYHTENSFLAFIDLFVCKLAGASNLIVHSHNTMDYRGGKVAKLSKYFKKPLYYLANKRLSCGDAAAIWLYGTTNNVHIIPLPVDCKKYMYSVEKQKNLKMRLGIKCSKIYTHVGSLSRVKNQLFVLDIFNEIHKIDNKAILLLIGKGDYEDKIRNKISKLNLENSVFMPGVINDVYDKLIMSDGFIFPSLFEGFPTVMLEAQAAGLPCYASDTITKRIAITDNVYFRSLDDSAKEWAEFIVNNNDYSENSRLKANKEIAKEYDIKKVVKDFYNVYEVD